MVSDIYETVRKSFPMAAKPKGSAFPDVPDSKKLLYSAVIEPVKIPGGSGMALEYTEEKLNSLDRETIIQLFPSQQEQLK